MRMLGTARRCSGRPILTGYERRMAIIADAATLPESSRERSLRRRLTVFDRRLTDAQAWALDRLASCIIATASIGTAWNVSMVQDNSFLRSDMGERSR